MGITIGFFFVNWNLLNGSSPNGTRSKHYIIEKGQRNRPNWTIQLRTEAHRGKQNRSKGKRDRFTAASTRVEPKAKIGHVSRSGIITLLQRPVTVAGISNRSSTRNKPEQEGGRRVTGNSNSNRSAQRVTKHGSPQGLKEIFAGDPLRR